MQHPTLSPFLHASIQHARNCLLKFIPPPKKIRTSRKMDSRLLFCKVIFTSHDEDQLEIPPNFVVQIADVLADEVVLSNRYMNTWPVKVSKTPETWCFKMGWQQFCRDNLIQVGDILVFNYKDKSSFDVTLFGEDGCEKANKWPPKVSVPKEEPMEYNAFEKDIEEEAGKEDQFVKKEPTEFEDGEEDYYTETDDTIDSSTDENYEEDDDDEDKDDDIDESNEDYEEEQVHKRKKSSSDKSKFSTKCGRDSTSPIPIKEEDGDKTNVKTKTRYKKQTMAERYGDDIFALGLALKPTNPYFVSRSRGSRRKNELHLPKRVIADYGLKLPESLWMVDEKGRKWKTRMKQWKDGRMCCRGGWGGLSLVNDIGIDDMCICEFLQGEGDDGFRILVRVVRTDKARA